MLFWTLFTACTQESDSTDPAIGNIQLCIAEDLLPSMETEEPIFVTGDLVNIRESTGDCAAELVVQVEDTEHIIGYSILDPEGNDTTFIPEWNTVEEVTLSNLMYCLASLEKLLIKLEIKPSAISTCVAFASDLNCPCFTKIPPPWLVVID